MSAPTRVRMHWDTQEYRQVVSVRFRQPHLFVTFADGAEVHFDVAEYGNAYLEAAAPEWSRAYVGEHEVEVPTANGVEGIPWDSIRLLTDPEFAADWDERVAVAALRTGRRVRELREERGLSRAELAARAGVQPTVVDEVESGRHGGDLQLTNRLLAGMGLDRRALIAPEEEIEGDEA
jgi:DNA-binding XRE family transcriptional regulator